MSQSTTISPSPISRKPVVLSRNDPFSMPVIHCFGFFLGMTASSLSVSILMARSSSVTRAHSASLGDWARPAPAQTNPRRIPRANDPVFAVHCFMRDPHLLDERVARLNLSIQFRDQALRRDPAP